MRVVAPRSRTMVGRDDRERSDASARSVEQLTVEENSGTGYLDASRRPRDPHALRRGAGAGIVEARFAPHGPPVHEDGDERGREREVEDVSHDIESGHAACRARTSNGDRGSRPFGRGQAPNASPGCARQEDLGGHGLPTETRRRPRRLRTRSRSRPATTGHHGSPAKLAGDRAHDSLTVDPCDVDVPSLLLVVVLGEHDS